MAGGQFAGKPPKTALFVNLHKSRAQDAAGEIRAELERRGMPVTVFSFNGKPEREPRGEWDIAVSLGGDGTVLYTARVAAASGIPILPVNLGTLGFIAAVKQNEWLSVFEQWLRGEARISKRCMLEISVLRQGETVARKACLNDAVVSASGIARLIRLAVQLELSSGGQAELGSYRADGLIIATPTGSTAYSMAAGGPILDPEMEALIINPICPFTLSSRPLVLSSRQPVSITVGEGQRSAVIMTVDGQDAFELEPLDRIAVRQAAYHAQLISADRGAYYSALRTKLAWSGAQESAHLFNRE